MGGDVHVLATAVGLAVAMLLAGVVGWRERLGAVLLAVLSGVWLAANNAFEGPILVAFSARHGITTADLVGIAGLIAAVLLWLRLRSR